MLVRYNHKTLLCSGSLIATLAALAAPASAQVSRPDATEQQQSGATQSDAPSGVNGASAATTGDQTQPDSGATTTPGAAREEEVIVTGSRIARSAVTAQPAEVLGSEQIDKLGYTNLGRALQELPAFSVPANSPIGAQGSYTAGATYVNLYNLGAQRTLSLVDGQRVVTTATSSIFGPVAGNPTDFSLIPTNLVDRVEVLSVGGAPIYGSDAIAGTVNILLKKNYQGVELTAQAGVATDYKDAGHYQLSALAGRNFADGRGNITLSVQYDKQEGVTSADRPAINSSSPFFTDAVDNSKFQQQLYYGGIHYPVFTNTGMPLVADSYPILSGVPYASVTNAAGQALIFNSQGRLVPFNNGQLTGSAIEQAGGDGFNIGDFGNFLADSDRVQATLLGHYDFSDHLKFNFEGWYGHDRATNLAAQPYYSTALFANAGTPNGDLIFSTNNPYLNPADRTAIINSLAANGSPTDTFYLARANTDLESGAFTSTSELFRFVGGFSGDFKVGSHPFSWEVTGNYGHSRIDTMSRELVTQNFYNAINAVAGANGAITCAPGYTNASIATYSSTCSPLNVFGVNQASQAALNYITAPADPVQTNQEVDIIADVKGSLLHLPGGDVKAVLGYEHRSEKTNFNPGTFFLGQLNADGSRTQYGNSIPITPVAGSYHTDEGFTELDVPIVSADMHIPLVHSLDVQGAARYVDDSLTSGFWTYTYGGTYSPVRDITFRGNYTRSFRGPAITEAFAPTAQVYNTANDPCDPRYITGGPDPARRAANCAAAGVPTTMVDPATGKTVPFKSNIVDFTVPGTQGGNPNLQNEVANSWTAGGVFHPSFFNRLTVTADYINIEVQNEIASLGAQDLMDACYDSATFPNDPFCKTFTRNAAGQITNFQAGNYNIGVERFRAIQATGDLKLPLTTFGLSDRFGGFDIGVNWLHTLEHYTRIGSGDKEYSVGGLQEPKDNITINGNYYLGKFNLLWQSTYYSPTRIDPNVPIATYQYPMVPGYWQHNLSVGVDVNSKFTVRAIIENVLDKSVPFPYEFSETRFFDEIMGRYVTISVNAKF